MHSFTPRKVVLAGDYTLQFELIPNETTPIQVRGGAIVRCVRGQLWITQENDEQDYIVQEGMYFQTSKKGLLVIAAMNDPSTAIVSRKNPGLVPPSSESGVRIDYDQTQRLISKADRMRSEELHRLCSSVLTWAWRLIDQRRPRSRHES